MSQLEQLKQIINNLNDLHTDATSAGFFFEARALIDSIDSNLKEAIQRLEALSTYTVLTQKILGVTEQVKLKGPGFERSDLYAL